MRASLALLTLFLCSITSAQTTDVTRVGAGNKKPAFIPYQNEMDSLEIDALTIENRTDRIAIYGSIELTRDRKGLQNARELKALLNTVVMALETEQALPAQISIRPAERIPNPLR